MNLYKINVLFHHRIWTFLQNHHQIMILNELNSSRIHKYLFFSNKKHFFTHELFKIKILSTFVKINNLLYTNNTLNTHIGRQPVHIFLSRKIFLLRRQMKIIQHTMFVIRTINYLNLHFLHFSYYHNSLHLLFQDQ
jgi:hypothetical protein